MSVNLCFAVFHKKKFRSVVKNMPMRIPSSYRGWRRLLEVNARLGRNIPLYYEEFCEEAETDEPPGVIQHITIRRVYRFTRYPNLQSPYPRRFLRDLASGESKTAQGRSTLRCTYSTLSEPLFRRLSPEFVHAPESLLDQEWFAACDKYIRHLPLRQKMSLVALTNKSQQHVQSWVRTGQIRQEFRDRVRLWRSDAYGYLPIFFQLADTHPSSWGKEYRRVVDQLAPHLTNAQIDEAVRRLVDEIRDIFKNAPRTRRTMILTRGIKEEIRKGQELRHPNVFRQGFAAGSLDPLHALLQYTDRPRGCCLQRITILPGTPLLFLGGLSSFPDDMECVLPDTVRYWIVSDHYETLPSSRTIRGCPQRSDLIRMRVFHVATV